MLQRLTIQNYALIEDLEIEFPSGLIILSGETGAGKSILLGALSLLLGAKADVSVLRLPEKNCVVEAEFTDGTLLRRVVAPSGRSRSFLNDEPLPLGEMAEQGQRRIDIHAQHQHLRLADPQFQLAVVDCFAETADLMQDYRRVFEEKKLLEETLHRLERQLAEQRKEQDFREFQFRQLSEARLVDGELDELELEQKRLAHAEDLLAGLSQASQPFEAGEVPLSQGLKASIQQLERCARHLPSLEALVERLQSCRIELDDIASEIQMATDSVEVSPERLMQVDERLSQLYGLLKRYDSSTLAELIAVRDRLDESLADASDGEVRLEQLRAQQTTMQQQLEVKAAALTKARCAVLSDLASQIETQIRDLEMPYAQFEIQHRLESRFTEQGQDAFVFLFSANGDAPSDVAKVASGGELSRLMLVLKALMAEHAAMPTLIFDEIDTGVSGRAADKMGELIGRMGKAMQLFAITHLPQIASKPASHFLVYKEYDEQHQAHTRLRLLTDSERVEEIARMLSGAQLTAASLANAQELINQNTKI